MLKIVMNCIEEIPCNPCETSCPFGAITVGTDITNIPVVDLDKCVGCGKCLAICPGLAIRMVDDDATSDVTKVGVVHEMFPMPDIDDLVNVINAEGTVVGTGIVKQKKRPLRDDPTIILIIEVPKKIAMLVHGIEHNIIQIDSVAYDGEVDSNTVICRCEEVYKDEVLAAIKAGEKSVDAIKRRTRAGMGLCQGNTCNQLVKSMLYQAGVEDLSTANKRTPVNAISLREMANISK